MEIKANPTNLIPANRNRFYVFFLLVETTIEIRRNSVFKKYSCEGKLIYVGGTDFPASGNYFFSPFF